MWTLWLDEPLPASCAPTLEGRARVLGPAETLEGFDAADACIAPGHIRYDAARLDRAPRLKVLARLGVGYDNVDLDAATARGIVVVYAPDGPTISTAEHTWALMLAVARKLNTAQEAVHTGQWASFYAREETNGIELWGCTIGLVGAGRIGARVARFARAFEMRVLAFDPALDESRAAELGVERAESLESLLAVADVVTLHVPYTPSTHHLMNAQRFAQMKRGALFINTARGSLVDEVALIAALRSGHLGGAGLDVFSTEPLPLDHPLLDCPNVVVTPHIASRTSAGRRRMWEITLQQALQALAGEMPTHILNPQVWPYRRR
ncbi:MAG: hydroxyacid dehydrogenase [Thermoflexales bacterium]